LVVRKARGWFLEFRIIPVLLWSFTSVGLGTALAFAEHGAFDPTLLAVALALAGLVQGWVTHAVNEIYDWRSGTDRHGRPRALSGGSKVRNLRLLEERDLWAIFWAASAAVAGLSMYVVVFRAAWLVLLIVIGYALGVAYTLPPAATAYRPFVSEWFGGFPGVLLAGLGAYGIQALNPVLGSGGGPLRPRPRVHRDAGHAPLHRRARGRGGDAAEADHRRLPWAPRARGRMRRSWPPVVPQSMRPSRCWSIPPSPWERSSRCPRSSPTPEADRGT